MAFPSSNGSKQENLAQAWSAARNTAGTIKDRTQSLYNQSAAGDINASLVLEYATLLADMKARLAQVAAISGIGAYAQAQIADPTLDVAAEYTSMATAIDETIAWVIANFPKDANGYLLAKQFHADGSGRTVDRKLTTAQTAGLRTQLSVLLAAID